MTVNENLEFYAKIKGIHFEVIPNIIDSLVSELKLSKFQHDISGNLRYIYHLLNFKFKFILI